MSKSTTGTKKTTGFIDHDSAKYVNRSDHGFTKRGSTKEDKDGAHIFGWGLYNAIATNTQGRPLQAANKKELHADLNHESNVRLKSSYVNRTLDERRDARIANAFVSGDAIEGKTTANRAYQAYKSASSFTTLDAVAEQLGNMKIYNPDTGRSHSVKNHSKFS